MHMSVLNLPQFVSIILDIKKRNAASEMLLNLTVQRVPAEKHYIHWGLYLLQFDMEGKY